MTRGLFKPTYRWAHGFINSIERDSRIGHDFYRLHTVGRVKNDFCITAGEVIEADLFFIAHRSFEILAAHCR